LTRESASRRGGRGVVFGLWLVSLGGSRRFGRWNVDDSLGVWLFDDNDAFPGTKERHQDPLTTLQGHVSYTFAPRLWLGLSGTSYAGGTTSVDGVSDRNRQGNSRAGLTLAIPVSGAAEFGQARVEHRRHRPLR